MAEEQEASVKALAAATQGTEKSFGRYPTRRCDVYVVSFSQGLLRARLSLCALLWKNNIKADLARAPFSARCTYAKTILRCTMTTERLAPLNKWQRHAREKASSSLSLSSTVRYRIKFGTSCGRVKPKVSLDMARCFHSNVATVPRTELVAYLTENIADQARVDMQLSSDRQGKEVNALAYSTPIKLAEQRSLASTGEVHLLTSETGKKQLARTRNLIAGKAEAAIASRIDALRDAVSLMNKYSPPLLTRGSYVLANLCNRDCR